MRTLLCAVLVLGLLFLVIPGVDAQVVHAPYRSSLPYVLYVSTTSVGNVGAGEDDLMSYTLPANVLNADGKVLRITAAGTYAATAEAKALYTYFGGTAVQGDSRAANNGSWRIEVVIIRTGAATEVSNCLWLASDTGGTAIDTDHAALSIDTTAAILIKLTGTATTTNDIVQTLLLVELLN